MHVAAEHKKQIGIVFQCIVRSRAVPGVIHIENVVLYHYSPPGRIGFKKGIGPVQNGRSWAVLEVDNYEIVSGSAEKGIAVVVVVSGSKPAFPGKTGGPEISGP